MTTLRNAPRRDIKILKRQGAVFLVDPRKFAYVRESKSVALSLSYKLVNKSDRCLLIGRQIISKEKCEYSRYIYTIKFWWLKPHDLGMPDEKMLDNNGDGYYWWGRNDDGTPRKNENPTIIPTEAVVFER